MFPYDKERIEVLRTFAVEPVICYDGFYLAFFERWAQNAAAETTQERYADAYDCALHAVEPVIDEGELVVGKASRPLSPEDAIRWDEIRKAFADPLDVRFGQDSHMAVDYELLLQEGVEGVVSGIDGLLTGETDEDKRQYYRIRYESSCKPHNECSSKETALPLRPPDYLGYDEIIKSQT